MGLYAYAVGAPFEAILNNYMITSEAIFPPGVDVAWNGSLTGIGMTNGSSLELTGALQEA